MVAVVTPTAALGDPEHVTVRVAHNVPWWLRDGNDWIYNQVVGASDLVEPYVVCDVIEQPGRYPVPHLYAASDRAAVFQLDRVLRKAGLRRHRSLLAQVVVANEVAVLHSHFAQTGWLNARLARRLEIAHVVGCYGEDMTKVPRHSRSWRRRYAAMFASIEVILCEGPHMSTTVAALGCPPEKIRMHPLGIDVGGIPFRPRGAPGDRPLRILLAAAFREKKGLPYAVHALGLLAQRGVRIEATVVGDARPGDGPSAHEKRKILDIVEQFGIGDRVDFTGFVSHDRLFELAYEHDAFLSPSVTAADGDAEGGAPVTVIEMAASGMPVISTTHCDIPFVLGEPNRRLLAPERDPEALADALQNLLRMEWEPLTRANRRRIEEQHDGREQALGLARIYRELAE